ncbi:hypothetical protein [Promicromonospora sp. NPDC023987]|uniref:hypothetical protein n=1 Tax=Promicromonospora sp. NPDC023987 TaxID=3155360 RepID=UPI0033BFB9DF
MPGQSQLVELVLIDDAGERLGAQRVADLTHQYGDGLTEPAVVYVVPSAGLA